jgi:hypothetical protein
MKVTTAGKVEVNSLWIFSFFTDITGLKKCFQEKKISAFKIKHILKSFV